MTRRHAPRWNRFGTPRVFGRRLSVASARLRCGMHESPMNRKLVPHHSHWGAFNAVVEDGNVVGAVPFDFDPDPLAADRGDPGRGAFAPSHRSPDGTSRLAEGRAGERRWPRAVRARRLGAGARTRRRRAGACAARTWPFGDYGRLARVVIGRSF